MKIRFTKPNSIRGLKTVIIAKLPTGRSNTIK